MTETFGRRTGITDAAVLTARRRSRSVLRGAVALAGSLLLVAPVAACTGGGAEGAEAAGAPTAAGTVPPDRADVTHRKAPARIFTRTVDEAVPSLYAHLQGTLVVTEDDCVAVATDPKREPVSIVWGHGWSTREENGKTAVYDAEGRLFAKEGDRVGLGGGSSGRGEAPCLTGQPFEANDDQAVA
ncbi:hypothetical protein ACFW2Y_18085 [Streptomyces sp. NPDC058877]|uniref:hypothetical protein n=1 Tax=unclassified Streptomyces TaxID=2593676 RepID=UPI0036C26A14